MSSARNGWTGCTLAFVTQQVSNFHYGVTASHCSTDFWTPDTGTFKQPGIGNTGRIIGYETADPNGTSCNLLCADWRYSDADEIYLPSTDTLKPGFLPRPSTRVQGMAGSLVIDPSAPWLTIASASGGLISGEAIDKIGRTTGWTHGTVTATCVDGQHGNWPNNHKLVCQGEASVYIDEGDSGSPVFIYDGRDGVQLAGIEWGSPSNPPNSDMLFSTFSDYTSDFGNQHPETNITVGTPSVSGSLSGSIPTLSWSAVSVTHTSGTTVYYVYRSVWDASTYTWTEQGHQLGSTTSTSYTDNTIPVTLYSYTGGSQPAQCVYTYVVYSVTAYNTGVGASSTSVYFQGDANGPTPGQLVCP